eukprot:15809-Eustigmatos_ZCMA.PRE.1
MTLVYTYQRVINDSLHPCARVLRWISLSRTLIDTHQGRINDQDALIRRFVCADEGDGGSCCLH